MFHKNYKQESSIVISGVESDRYWDIVVNQCEVKTVLMSYQYIQRKPQGFLKERLDAHPDVKIFVDSGAHTFLTNFDEYKDMSDDFWDTYLRCYVDWVRANKDYIFACADLDIDLIVGQEKVDQWRKEYFEPLEEEGIQVCYIWHINRGEQGWEDMCRKYSYIGFSMENDKEVTLQRVMKRINTAKKYNTRVHGMALTKTEILVRVPFFTADSTTWLVGQQYGELNWFNGRKMQRLKKSEWRRNFKTKLIKEPFFADWDKLINGMGGRGDTYELLRLNVIAFMQAQEHIRKRLHAKMYWLGEGSTASTKPRKMRRVNTPVESSKPSTGALGAFKSIDKELSIKYPSKEWFSGDMNDWAKYAMQFKIDVDTYTKEEATNLLYYFKALLDDESMLDDLLEEDVIQYAQAVIDESIDEPDDAIKELRQYFQDNLDGTKSDFMEDPMQDAKERTYYVDEDDFITIDLQVTDLPGANALPSPSEMPEVEAYDAEMKRQGVEIVRDSKGRFVKGQKAVRKRKNIYSEQFPKLVCDTCYKSGDCPKYKPGMVCAFDKMFKKFDTRDAEDIMDAMESIVNHNIGRMQKAMMFEAMDGGMPTPEVTSLMDMNIRYLEKLAQIKQKMPGAILSQRRVVKQDGTEETVTEMNVSNPSQGGILSQIFGAPASSEPDMDEDTPKSNKAVDVEYKVEE